MEPKKVLVVDDEKDLREALNTALTYEGFVVEQAGDGVEARAKAEKFKPDLILLDIIMPIETGIDALRALRAEEWGKDIPVIMMTVLDDMEKVSAALEMGAVEYLVKTDVSLVRIVEKVKERLGATGAH